MGAGEEQDADGLVSLQGGRAWATCRASQRASASRAARPFVPGKQRQMGRRSRRRPGAGVAAWNSTPSVAAGHDGASKTPLAQVIKVREARKLVVSNRGFQGKVPAAAQGRPLAGLLEEAHLGLAPAVDGLLGVPHHHQGAAGARLPARQQAAEQGHLGLAGVLELVHQQMRQAAVQAQEQVAGVFHREQPQGGLLQGDEVQGLPAGRTTLS